MIGVNAMKVKTSQLVEGCVLKNDIFLSSPQPFMRKKTILDKERIQILNAFLIDEVEVEAHLINGEEFVPDPSLANESEEEKGFFPQYIKAVEKYHKLFQNWMSGKNIDHLEVRQIVVPLFKELMKNPGDLLLLHHYSEKEAYLYHHAVSVSLLSAFIGQKMNLSKQEWMEVGVAGALADSGMSQIDRKIIEKPGRLTYEEFEEIKKHPIIAYNKLKTNKLISNKILLAVLQHHEREDGSGYPLGVKGDKIHLYGQIVAVADVYHAMTSERHYRSKKSPYLVLEELWNGHFGKLNVKVVRTFVKSMLNFSIGTTVQLSNGKRGEIVFYNEQNPTRPMIKLLDTDEIINLSQHLQLFIEEVIV